MRHFSIIMAMLAFLFFSQNSFSQQVQKSLLISKNGRYLAHADGSPFFYLGDTAWELFHKLDRKEATYYLKNRAKKGFTVIQAVVLAENNGLKTPNPYGEVPFFDLDPTLPNDKYFEHVDFIVDKAEKLGMYIGMLPTWGDKLYSKNPGAGPIVFNKENAEVYGRYLGNRYKDKPIIWVLGGDRGIANEEVLNIWRAMAKGIKEGDGGRHLITYHPRGATSSSKKLHNEEWLDFNTYQSGHSHSYTEVYRYAQHDYNLEPFKPTLDSEPPYEDIAVAFWNHMNFGKQSADRVPAGVLDDEHLIVKKSHFKDGFFDAYDVRVHGYWNLLSGSCGYTYGNNAVWQMFKKGGEVAIPCLYDWKESLDRPGASQMIHLKKLFEAYSFAKLVPDQSVIEGKNERGSDYITAALASDASFLIAYMAKGQPCTIRTSKLKASSVEGFWYDTRTGKRIGVKGDIGRDEHTFTPPSSGRGNDWALVLSGE